jgi:hypothetical protein
MRLHLAASLLCLTVLGCGENASHTTGPALCSPIGMSVACFGADVCRGAQTCGKDGTYGKCDCGVAPLATCGVVGATVACFGVGGCVGAQVCGADGSYGACACLPALPASDAGAATPITLQVKAPVDYAVWKGTVQLSGITTGPVAGVGISVGGGPYQVASGTANWKVSYDTSHLPNGNVSVVVAAVAPGQDVRVTVPVIVDNLDPIIGGWRLRSPYGSFTQRGCWVQFLPSGAYTDPCNILPFGPGTWTRESPDTISLHVGYNGNVVSVRAVFSVGDRVLALTTPPTGWRAGTYSFDLVERIDPYLPTVQVDAGPLDDGGYVPYYPGNDAGT